jgi:hypothetical protein
MPVLHRQCLPNAAAPDDHVSAAGASAAHKRRAAPSARQLTQPTETFVQPTAVFHVLSVHSIFVVFIPFKNPSCSPGERIK